jgi:monoamine oxidase
MRQSTKNIVLVHGGFVDGAGWESVYSLLKKDDYNVAIVEPNDFAGRRCSGYEAHYSPTRWAGDFGGPLLGRRCHH